MAGAPSKLIVAKILIYPEARDAFLREVAIEGLTKKCEIDVSAALHPCFTCHVVSVQSREIFPVLHVLECARLLNRLQSDNSGCILLLSLESAARIYKSLKNWSERYKIYLTCMRRADVIRGLPERWLIMEGSKTDIKSCLETIIQNISSHPQMRFKVDYSFYTPLSNAGVWSQIQRAEAKKDQEKRKKPRGKEENSSKVSGKRALNMNCGTCVENKDEGCLSISDNSRCSDRLNSISAKSSGLDMSCDFLSRDPMPRRPGLRTDHCLERSSMQTIKSKDPVLGIGRGAIRSSMPKLVSISQLMGNVSI